MRHRPRSALSLIELLVVLCIIAILASLALPALHVGFERSASTQMLSNMKQLHLATQQMALDGTTTGDTNIGWPGDLDGSFDSWATNIVNGYLTTNDFCKLLSAHGRITTLGQLPRANTNAVLVYAVSGTSPGDAVFLSSANFTNTPTGGLPLAKDSLPYGQAGFIVFRKGGDGAILLNRQVGAAYTNLIGSYVPLCTSDPSLLVSPVAAPFIWEQVAAALLILALLAFALFTLMRRPPFSPALQARQILSCMKQLHLATMHMALDRSTTGNENVSWPGDLDGTFATWASKLAEEDYLTPSDLRQMLTGKYGSKPPRKWFQKKDLSVPRENTHAILVYAVREDSPPNSIFLSSANFINTPEGGSVYPDSPLMDGKYFVVMTLSGEGFIVPIHPPETDHQKELQIAKLLSAGTLPPAYLPAEQWAVFARSFAPLCR